MGENRAGWHWSGLVALLCLSVLCPMELGAQDRAVQSNSAVDGVAPTFGLRLGPPQKASVYAGLRIGRQGDRSGRKEFVLTLEPGLGGCQVSVARVWSGGGHVVPGISLAAGASVFRTWGKPWGVAPDQTYIGAEGRLGFSFVAMGLGRMYGHRAMGLGIEHLLPST